MTTTLLRGQKTDLTKKYPGITELIVGMGWELARNDIEIDAAAFMLQGNGKCRGDEDFIFYGNPKGRNEAVAIVQERTSDKSQIKINLKALPADVEKVAFTLTIHDGPLRGHNFGQVPASYLRVAHGAREELLRFNMGGNFNAETAIVVAELYRHQGEWKLNAIAMGYQGGLAALCGGFGIVVASQPADSNAQREPADKPDTPPKTPQAQPGPKINLQKIELKKKGEKVNLAKKTNNQLGEILVNLNWNQQQTKSKGMLSSLFGGGNKGVDLDLGCLIEMRDGSKGVIQALGNSFGSYSSHPYLALDGDDRTGAVAGGENIRINGNYILEFKRILVFAFIYQGVANWAQADGVVTIKQIGSPDIEVKLDEHDGRKLMCAIALFENVKNETFSVERVVRYFSGHREMDQAFGWGLNWKSGRKD